MARTRIGVVGCGGRMGKMLLAEIAATPECVLAGGTAPAGSAILGQDVGTLAGLPPMGLSVAAHATALFGASDVVIDFTAPAASCQHAEIAARAGTALVIGTTALSAEQSRAVEAAATRAPILLASNTSLGVNLLFELVEQVAARLGRGWDIEIVEMHHGAKADAPSGTALSLGRAAASGRGVSLESVSRRGRDGMTGARADGEIGFAALRGGDVVGDHTVIFAAAGERLELTHRATSRIIYAKGAVRAAQWLVGRAPGLYGMKQVLDL